MCARDVGARYGAGSTVDVCQEPAAPATLAPNWASCTADAECSSGRWGCNGGTYKRCLPTAAYPRGCSAAGWSCGRSAYLGAQIWTCSGGNIYRCDAQGQPTVVVCPDGCRTNKLGVDDSCR